MNKTTLDRLIDVNRALRILLYEISKLDFFKWIISMLRKFIK